MHALSHVAVISQEILLNDRCRSWFRAGVIPGVLSGRTMDISDAATPGGLGDPSAINSPGTFKRVLTETANAEVFLDLPVGGSVVAGISNEGATGFCLPVQSAATAMFKA